MPVVVMRDAHRREREERGGQDLRDVEAVREADRGGGLGDEEVEHRQPGVVVQRPAQGLYVRLELLPFA